MDAQAKARRVNRATGDRIRGEARRISADLLRRVEAIEKVGADAELGPTGCCDGGRGADRYQGPGDAWCAPAEWLDQSSGEAGELTKSATSESSRAFSAFSVSSDATSARST